MINVRSAGEEYELLNRFFLVDDFLEKVIGKIKFDETKPNEVSTYTAFSMGFGDLWTEYADIVIPTTLHLIEYNTMRRLTNLEKYLSFTNKNNKNIECCKKTESIFALVADVDTGNVYTIYPDNTDILPKIVYRAVGLNEMGLDYTEEKIKGDLLSTTLAPIKKGYALLYVLSTHSCNSGLCVLNDKEENTFTKKLLGHIIDKQSSFKNTKQQANIYLSQWEINDKGEDIYSDEYKFRKRLFTPVVKTSTEKFEDEYRQILLTGKGKITLTIEGVKENGESVSENPISQ